MLLVIPVGVGVGEEFVAGGRAGWDEAPRERAIDLHHTTALADVRRDGMVEIDDKISRCLAEPRRAELQAGDHAKPGEKYGGRVTDVRPSAITPE